MQNETRGMLYGLIVVIAFGLTLPATRVIVPHMDPVFIGLGRAVLAAVVAAMILGFTRQKFPNKAQIVQLTIVVMGVAVAFPVLSSWAMQYVPAAHGGVVLGVLPLATAIVGVLIGNEKPSMAFWLMSLLGTTLVVSYSLLQGAGDFHVADIALFGAIISTAVGYAYGARLSKTLGGWQVICWALVLACPFILYRRSATRLKRFQACHCPCTCFLYLALVSQLFGIFAWYKGLALGGIVRLK
jgi:drug/metabolite transporter (DMT)-like permease